MSASPQTIHELDKFSTRDEASYKFCAVALPHDDDHFILAHIFRNEVGQEIASYMTFRNGGATFLHKQAPYSDVKLGKMPENYQPVSADIARAYIDHMGMIIDL